MTALFIEYELRVDVHLTHIIPWFCHKIGVCQQYHKAKHPNKRPVLFETQPPHEYGYQTGYHYMQCRESCPEPCKPVYHINSIATHYYREKNLGYRDIVRMKFLTAIPCEQHKTQARHTGVNMQPISYCRIDKSGQQKRTHRY